jgi:hypothetical protein
MYKVTYTAYLPETVSLNRPKRRDGGSYDGSNSGRSEDAAYINYQLDDYTRRLDKHAEKLENLEYSCGYNLAKCKVYYNSARKMKTHLA